ncbi:MAG: GIY-YIG nuclease family protein [Candidatus Bathyarchaeota archaeon]|nr:GIY-YIG nuclease family protein [Candidatus Bathyarchaeum tardum]
MNIDSTLVSNLSTRGVYILLLFISKEITVTAGKLGKQTFPRGYYTYTGSALGKGSSLKHRISRHLKKHKKMFWHIDYLMVDSNVSVKAIVITETGEKIECKVNSYLMGTVGTKILVKGFGASDCNNGCKSHLLFFAELVDPNKIVQEFLAQLQLLPDVSSVIVIK